MDPTRLYDALAAEIRPLESAVVAYSGGVDSTLVMAVCHRELRGRTLAVTAVSPSVSRRELEAAGRIAALLGVPHRLVDTHELDNPEYRANAPNRCYFCKSELFGTLETVRAAEGFRVIVDGYNRDDVGDWRPGVKAGEEHHVVSPLKRAGLGKAEIRELARWLGLPNWDKPAAPCLASRIPYFTAVTVEGLRQIEAAEDALHDLGFGVVRVRHHRDLARIEVPVEDLPRLVALGPRVEAALRAVGYRYVTVDLGGFRSGSLNRVLEVNGGAVNA
jgi:uncharacterized protein